MAEGHAFKCDMCGRVAFVPGRPYEPEIAAPSRWLMLVQAPESDLQGIVWDKWHFCTVDCVQDFIQRSIAERDAPLVEPEPLRDRGPDFDEPIEQVLSEWDADDDDDDHPGVAVV